MTIEVATVYSASRRVQKVTEAPATVTIVTSDDIQRYGYRTLADILRNIRGFYVTDDRNYNYIGFRGFARPGDYNTNILLLVDGHRLNENVYEMAFIGTTLPLDVELVDRVEIIRGPSSSIYGANAFFGVINIITKRGYGLRGAEVSSEWASLGTGKGRVTYGNRFQNGLDVLLSGSLYASHGQRRLYFKEFDDPATNNGIAENADDDQYQQLFVNLSYRDFTLQAACGSRDKRIPTASYGTVFNDPRTRTTDMRSYVDLAYERNFGSRWEVIGRLYYDHYVYDGSYIYDYSQLNPPTLVVNRDLGFGKWWGTELKLTRSLGSKHKFTCGSEYRHNLQQGPANYDEEPFFQYLDDRRGSRLWALYFQDEFTLHNALILNLGLRHDHYGTSGGATSPRLGLIYSPREKTTLKFLCGEAFRTPNALETYYQGIGYKANPSIKPETIRTYEAVWEQYLGRRFRMTVTSFRYQTRRLISQETDPVGGLLTYQNTERIDAGGLELEMAKKWTWGLDGRLSYAFQDAEDTITQTRLSNSPKHLGTLHVSVVLVKKKLFASLAGHYVSNRRTLGGNYAGPYVIPNFTLFGRNLWTRWEVSASVYNLLNKKYADPGAGERAQDIIPQDGRRFRLKVVCKF